MKKQILLFLSLWLYLNGYAIPVINSFSPVSGTPGTTVTITGTGFSATPTNNIVYFGAIKATVSASTATSIKITVPVGAGSVVPVSVTVQGAVAYSTVCSTPTFTLTNSPNLDLVYNRTDIAIVGNNLGFIDIGDFNGDGKDDLVVTDYISNKVKVLLGNGDGTFASPVNSSVGSGAFFVKVGDFNGDGKADLVTSNGVSKDVSILLGNGDGTFTTAVNYPTGTGSWFASIGDFNKDGKADLVVANETLANVSVLLGIGDGTFATAVNYYSLGSYPKSVIVGDFNGDRKADLATANYGNSKVGVLLGKGDGTFETAVNYSVGTTPYSITIGDFNKDGKTDLATANYNSNNVSVLLGIGDGTFAASVNYSVGTNPYSVTVGDFNGDGKTDLATASSYGNVSVFLGIGDGTFATAVDFTACIGSWSVAVGDFNGDGKTDWASANGHSNNISVFLNTSLAITTQAVSSIASTTATGNGTITALGLSNPTAYGVCWNTTGTPTSSDSHVDNGASSAIETFTALMTGLAPNTTYHVRAYATNNSGTVYGNEVTFTTNAVTGFSDATLSTLSIYPNPTTDNFFVKNLEGPATVNISDISGRLLLSKDVTAKETVTVSTLPNGVYLVTIQLNNTRKTEKLIIQR